MVRLCPRGSRERADDRRVHAEATTARRPETTIADLYERRKWHAGFWGGLLNGDAGQHNIGRDRVKYDVSKLLDRVVLFHSFIRCHSIAAPAHASKKGTQPQAHTFIQVELKALKRSTPLPPPNMVPDHAGAAHFGHDRLNHGICRRLVPIRVRPPRRLPLARPHGRLHALNKICTLSQA